MEFHPSLLNLFLWVLFVILLCPRCLGCADDERTALLEIKASARYPDSYTFSTWVEDKTSDYCYWNRIKCSNTTGCVSQLDLSYMFIDVSLLNVSLFLPFKDLQHLDISENSIIGTKGHQGFEKLAKLKKLQVLDLSYNYFNTNVLEPLSELTSLRTLNLGDNNLGESSSSEISQGFEKLAKLKKLQVLNLAGNRFDASVLEPLSELTSLTTLNLAYNYLGNSSSSEISQGFCELKKLQGIDLSDNNLKGEIPLCLVNFTSLRILDLSNNQLGGNIPPSLTANMTSLKALDFSNNRFAGSIPLFSLFNSRSVQYISFRGNQFQGAALMTSSLEQNFQLKHLDLSNCNLNISTPSLLKLLYSLSDLRFIFLSHNNIHGKFPLWLVANNTKLETMVLSNNSFSGDIHFPLHLRTNLEWVDLSKNHIEGHLQTNLGHVLQRVYYLNLAQNHLEGSIPTSLGNIQYLNVLDLSNNNFTGEIPESLRGRGLFFLILSNNRLHGQIFFNSSSFVVRLNNNQFTGIVPLITKTVWNLITLDVSKNNLSGRIPSWIANLTGVKTLVMRDNSFHGPIPLELCNSASLEYLDLSENELSGNIPSCLNLTSLRYIHLEGNKLSGSLPPAIRRSPNLVTLSLNHNNFSGSIPGWLGLLENLGVLLLNGNHLSGIVPYELCKSNKIWILDLSHNGFSGKIPPCLRNIAFGSLPQWFPHDLRDGVGIGAYADNIFDNFPEESRFYVSQEEVEFMTKGQSRPYKGDILNYMSGMDLSCNSFTGHIPPELGALIVIRALNLSHNQLTGPIPKTLSKLKQLESMDLSHNKLSGEIPSELTGLTFLSTFVVAYNNLSGRVPTMNQQFSTFTETSYQGNRYLCGPPLLKQCTGAAAPTDSATATATDASLSDVFGVDPISFLASCAGAYVMSFLALVIVLYINPHWRRLWFDSVDACLSFIFPFWSEAFYRVSNPFT